MDSFKILEFAAYGAAAALLGTMVRDGRLQVPRIYSERGREGHPVRFIDPGFLGSVLLGAALAAYFDGRAQTAAAYGLAAGYAGPALLNALAEPLLKRLGMDDIGVGSTAPKPGGP